MVKVDRKIFFSEKSDSIRRSLNFDPKKGGKFGGGTGVDFRGPEKAPARSPDPFFDPPPLDPGDPGEKRPQNRFFLRLVSQRGPKKGKKGQFWKRVENARKKSPKIANSQKLRQFGKKRGSFSDFGGPGDPQIKKYPRFIFSPPACSLLRKHECFRNLEQNPRKIPKNPKNDTQFGTIFGTKVPEMAKNGFFRAKKACNRTQTRKMQHSTGRIWALFQKNHIISPEGTNPNQKIHLLKAAQISLRGTLLRKSGNFPPRKKIWKSQTFSEKPVFFRFWTKSGKPEISLFIHFCKVGKKPIFSGSEKSPTSPKVSRKKYFRKSKNRYFFQILQVGKKWWFYKVPIPKLEIYRIANHTFIDL